MNNEHIIEGEIKERILSRRVGEDAYDFSMEDIRFILSSQREQMVRTVLSMKQDVYAGEWKIGEMIDPQEVIKALSQSPLSEEKI